MPHKARVSLVAAIALLLSAPMIVSALAQTAVADKVVAKAEAMVGKLASTCKSDIATYCPKVVPGGGRMAFCMLAHEDQISDKCYGAIFDAVKNVQLSISNIWRAAEVCDSEIDKVCGNVEPGEGRIAQCLIDNKTKLGTNCQAEVAGFQARLKK
jgi:Cysteine rich repeat